MLEKAGRRRPGEDGWRSGRRHRRQRKTNNGTRDGAGAGTEPAGIQESDGTESDGEDGIRIMKQNRMGEDGWRNLGKMAGGRRLPGEGGWSG